jgi:phosphoglycerate dehydrogenase-like enzyme
MQNRSCAGQPTPVTPATDPKDGIVPLEVTDPAASPQARVWVPYDEMVADVEAVAGRGHVDVYTGRDVPASTETVEFLVAPYATTAEALTVTAKLPALRVLQLLSAGYEHALPYLPDGVTLCSGRGIHDASTAELAVALTLASLRRIGEFARAQLEHGWLHAEYPALADKHVLIVGYGAIGAAVERRLLPFETTVTRVARRARPAESVHGIDEIQDLLPDADVVIVVTPLTEQTRHLVNERFIAAMKRGALLVNVSRGGVVDQDALLAALHARRIRAALDVTDPEPLPVFHPLWGAPGVLISPHVGGNTSAFLPRARRLVREQVARFVRGEPLQNVVAGPAPATVAPDAAAPAPGARETTDAAS